jgi:glutaredoxin
MTKEFFKENNVEYTEHDVSVDSEKAQEMVDLSGQMGVPVVVIGEGDDQSIIIGFDEPKLKESLGL